jgi:hypothetical protein
MCKSNHIHIKSSSGLQGYYTMQSIESHMLPVQALDKLKWFCVKIVLVSKTQFLWQIRIDGQVRLVYARSNNYKQNPNSGVLVYIITIF